MGAISQNFECLFSGSNILKHLRIIGFEADEKVGETIIIDKALVKEQVGDMLKAQDLQKFIL